MTTTLRKIAEFSEHHRALVDREETLPTADDIEAIEFFLYRSFFGARSVELSNRYFEHAKSVIDDHERTIRRVLHHGQAEAWPGVIERELREGIGNKADCRMVVSLIDWLGSGDWLERNVVNRSLDHIQRGTLAGHHGEIRDNVHNVGPKKTSLYLRDVVGVGGFEAETEDDWAYIIPVDTRLSAVASRVLEADIDPRTWDRSAAVIAKACRERSVSPVRFDEGAWYLSANAIDVVIDFIHVIDPSEHQPRGT